MCGYQALVKGGWPGNVPSVADLLPLLGRIISNSFGMYPNRTAPPPVNQEVPVDADHMMHAAFNCGCSSEQFPPTSARSSGILTGTMNTINGTCQQEPSCRAFLGQMSIRECSKEDSKEPSAEAVTMLPDICQQGPCEAEHCASPDSLRQPSLRMKPAQQAAVNNGSEAVMPTVMEVGHAADINAGVSLSNCNSLAYHSCAVDSSIQHECIVLQPGQAAEDMIMVPVSTPCSLPQTGSSEADPQSSTPSSAPATSNPQHNNSGKLARLQPCQSCCQSGERQRSCMESGSKLDVMLHSIAAASTCYAEQDNSEIPAAGQTKEALAVGNPDPSDCNSESDADKYPRHARSETPIGRVLFLQAALFNHSCQPNCYVHRSPSGAAVIALTSIEVGLHHPAL